MDRPNPDQIRAAAAILKQFSTNHAGTASDTALERGVYSIAAALGAPGEPEAEYHDAIKAMSDLKPQPMVAHDQDSFTVLADNPLGLPVGASYARIHDHEEADEAAGPSRLTLEELAGLKKRELVDAINAELEEYEAPFRVSLDDGTKQDIIDILADYRAQIAPSSPPEE